MLPKYVLIFVLFYSFGQTQENKCMKMPLIDNFDVKKIAGKWYTQAISNIEDGRKKCLYFDLSYTKDGNNNILLAKRIWNEHVDNFKLFQKGNTSKFFVEWQGNVRPLWVVATDYTTFVVWYICYPERHSESTLAFTTREPKRNEALLKKAEDAVKDIDFKSLAAKLIKVPHDECD